MLCFREEDIGIGKVDEKLDDIFLTEGVWGKVLVEGVGAYSIF